MKPQIAIASLTSCGGCLTSIIELDIFAELLDTVDFVYFPLIKDKDKFNNCDIALIEGYITNDEQKEELLEIRHKAKKVIAVGSCSIFGGITSLSKELGDSITPIREIIEIDGFIPGCPPPIEFLGNMLMALLNGKKIELPVKNLCSECELRPDNGLKEKIKIDKLLPEKVPFDCFLHENVLCLGPITRSGCKAKCIKSNIPCEGCMGPVTSDYESNMINFFSVIEVADDIKKKGVLHPRFTRPKSPYEKGETTGSGEKNEATDN